MSLIRELRCFKGLTQEMFGRPLGWDIQEVSRAECTNACSLKTFLRIGICHNVPDNLMMKLAREHYLSEHQKR